MGAVLTLSLGFPAVMMFSIVSSGLAWQLMSKPEFSRTVNSIIRRNSSKPRRSGIKK